MRAGFAAGAVMALMDKGLVDFDAAVAVSASVPTLAYFAAGQRKAIERVWRDELNTSKLVCYRNIAASPLTLSSKKSILDINYLVYEVMKAKYPIDVSAIIESRMVCRFAVAKVPDGKLAFLSPKRCDVYKIFHAALAVPGCCPEPVCVEDCEYVDAGAVNPIPLHEVFDGEVDRVLAVLTRPPACRDEPLSLWKKALFWRYFQRYPWMLESLQAAVEIYNERVAQLVSLTRENPARALIICPDRMPPAKFVTRDKEKINETIDLGYQQVEKMETQIREFLR